MFPFRQVLVAALVGLALGASATKINDSLASALLQRGSANVMVSFSADVNQVHERIARVKFASRGTKITAMKVQLESLAESSQKAAVEHLKSKHVKFESLWINNRIYIADAGAELVSALAAIPQVSEIREEKIMRIGEPMPADQSINAEWGIDMIEAPAAWVLPGGNNGAGVVVANIDTGVRVTHQDLRGNFRADYGWYDPYNSTSIPDDDDGHGTHIMGTIAGANGTGVAPGAQWIACRGCTLYDCTEVALVTCGQWIACPTLANGTTPDCSKAPQIVSNSWGWGQGDPFYSAVVTAWHSAGIIPTFAQGNFGPTCATAASPGDYDNVIGVGSTNSSDGIAPNSSRGPSSTGLLKPDITAPGVNVRSAAHTGDDEYIVKSGTSMASPHVAGAAALLLGRNPNLTFAQVKDLLQNNADRALGAADSCGGTPPTTFPNNIYGHGRVNARKSLAAAISGLY